MKMYYIRSKVVARVRGISGPIEKIISHLVKAESLPMARFLFEQTATKEFSESIVNFAGATDNFTFEYQEVATEI